MKSWLQDNDVEIYLEHNEEKSVVAERFNKTSKNEICKHMTFISKNIDKFLEIVKQYNNTAHNKIKMKSVDAKPENLLI